MAPWLPPLRQTVQRQYVAMTRAARLRTGEYVKHLPEGGAAQWLVMEYQDMPENQSLIVGALQVSTSGPVVFGLVEEFDAKPSIYRKGVNSNAPHRGSRVIVRGITYQAKEVRVHHRGGVTISLNRDECCTIPDPLFFEEMEAFTCWREPVCGA